MTNVDFYVLEQDSLMARLHFACRLSEKSFQRGHQVVLAVNDKAQAAAMSDYLWSFKPESFLPHALEAANANESNDRNNNNGSSKDTQNAAASAATSPITLSWSDHGNHPHHDLLINLRDGIPDGFSQFHRVMEVVVQDTQCLRATREHFQFYRSRGYPLKSHPVSSNNPYNHTAPSTLQS